MCEKKKILIVEDEPTCSLILSTAIHLWGYEVHNAEHGGIALEKLERETFHLIIMDCCMPILDGFATTQMIRKQELKTNKHVPIIAITALAEKEDVARGYDAGMDTYMTKPVDISELRAEIERLLGVFQMLQRRG